MNEENELNKKGLNQNDFPVFRSSETFSNMRKERFVVPQRTSFFICEEFVLTEEAQKTTIDKLVDRTPNWLEMSDEEQKDSIKATLVLQTVAEYLYAKSYIQKNCDMYENGYDKDGNVVLDAFYIKKTKDQVKWKNRIKAKKKMKRAPVVKLKDFSKGKWGRENG